MFDYLKNKMIGCLGYFVVILIVLFCGLVLLLDYFGIVLS